MLSLDSRVAERRPAFFGAAFVVFVAAGLVKPILILFGAVDFGGGVWTFQAMKKDRQSRRRISRI